MAPVRKRGRTDRRRVAAAVGVAFSAIVACEAAFGADQRACAGAAPAEGPDALGVTCLLAGNPSLRAAQTADPAEAARIIEEIRRRYQALPGEAFDPSLRPRGPLPEGLGGAPVLAPIYRTDPEAALDLLRRIRDASGRAGQ